MKNFLWLEKQYLSNIQYKLSMFTKKTDSLYNMRCPFCGDSQKHKFKARGYVYLNDKTNSLWYKCHNCNINLSFNNFLKKLDNNIYDDYLLDVFKEKQTFKFNKTVIEKTSDVEEFNYNKILNNLENINDFPKDHPVYKYIKNRQIPSEKYSSIFYCKRFMEWINTILPEKFNAEQLKVDEPRIIIPFFDKDGNLFAVAGRSFKKKSIKYITIKFVSDEAKIYGMDRIDMNKRVYIVEGPIDSFFIDNCIAFAGSSGYIPEFNDSVIVLDNEPRNKEIIKQLEKFISLGYKICIWPKSMPYKDINEMIVNGFSKEEIKNIIDTNTYSGLMATAKLSEWKVVRKNIRMEKIV
jgi:hypothetical protein